MCVCVCVHTFASVDMCVYVCMSICTHICVYVCLTNTHFHTNTLNLSLLCSKTLEYTKKDDSNTHMERRDVGRQGGGYGGERESFNGTKLNANIVNN